MTSGGRRFNRDWIFRGLNTELTPGTHTLIVGPNGSGKSTLLQSLSGFLELSEGQVHYTIDEGAVSPNESYRHLAVCAPYLELFDDLTLAESVRFQSRFRPFQKGMTPAQVIEICELSAHADKPVRNFSSGMKQRLKLALTILADASLVLLDEPTSNLDRQAIQWYRNLLSAHADQRTIVVSSNHNPDDYLRADLTIDITTLK